MRKLKSWGPLAILVACCVMGCQSSDETETDTAHRVDNQIESNDALSSSEPVLRSGNPYRAALTKKALRGLDYSSGRVVVDVDLARELTVGLAEADAQVQATEATSFLAQGKILSAIESATRMVILDSESAKSYELLGKVLLVKRKAKLAEAALRTALDIDPSSVSANNDLAFLLAVQGNATAAIEQYDRALQLDPNNGQLHGRLAIQHYYQGNRKLAEQHVAQASQLGYSSPPQFLRLLDGDVAAVPRSNLNGGAPNVGAQIRVDLSNPDPGNETTAASTNSNPECIVAGWNDYGDGVRSGFALTTDGGDNWQDFFIRPPAPFQTITEGDPMTAYDNRTGNLWAGAIAFGGNGGIYVARKGPQDATFGPATMAVITGGADKGWMAAGPAPNDAEQTRLYVGYNQGLLISTDEGDSYNGPLGFPEFGLGWLPRVGPNGELYLSYWDASDGIKLLRSFDGGNTLQGPFTIATRMDVWFVEGSRFPGAFRVAPLAGMAVDPNDGTLYVVYFDTTEVVANGSNVDIYFCKSTDQGSTWTDPVVINTDAEIPGDQFFSWIEVSDDGRLHLLFYDTRSQAQNDNVNDIPNSPSAIIETYYSYSDDGGDSWSDIVLTAPFDSANDGFGDGFIGDYLGMAISGTTVWPCYLSTQDGVSNVYVQEITNSFLLGDINGDGAVNLLDVDPFIDLIGSGEFDKAGDINGDGSVDLLDVAGFIDLIGS